MGNVNETAKRIVEQEVRYCVSALISTLIKGAFEPGSIMDEDDAMRLAAREPDADDYRDNAPAGLQVRADGDSWKWKDGEGLWSPPFDTEVEAWRDAFEELNEDQPDGTEVYEHWLVTDWLAEKLKAHGESVADDVEGLTVWGRCTTGQAIYMDHVIQEIARELNGPEPLSPDQWHCKVALPYSGNLHGYSILDAAIAGAVEFPHGWELCELDGSGARCVAVFSVDPGPTPETAGAAQAALDAYAKREPQDI